MTHYPDLTPYSYAGGLDTLLGKPVLNVGWLGEGRPFPTGRTTAQFRQKLLAFCRDEYAVARCRGFHTCELCDPSRDEWPVMPHLGEAWGSVGNGEIRVLGDSTVYAAPTMIIHYVLDHDYLPPAGFIAAVLAGAPASPEHHALRLAADSRTGGHCRHAPGLWPAGLAIRLIRPEQFAAARQVMDAVIRELWDISLEELRRYDHLDDMDDIQAHYLDSGGTFLVVVDGERVVGTGGIRPVDTTTCELRRIWLRKAYRGRGLGKQLTQQLLDFATTAGYGRVRLLVATPCQQRAAVTLYHRLGFRPVAWLEEPPGAMVMEKQLAPVPQMEQARLKTRD